MAKKFKGDLKEYKTKYLRCRGRRNHPWKHQTDFNIATKGDRIIEFTQTLRCALCQTIRKDTYDVNANGRFSRRGHPVYEYPDGYELHAHSRVPLDDARDELLFRELSSQLDAELLNRLLNTRPDARPAPSRHLRAVGE